MKDEEGYRLQSGDNLFNLQRLCFEMQIPQEEKKQVLKQLIDSCGDRKSVQVDNENFYKVPVPLLKKRKEKKRHPGKETNGANLQ